MTSPPRFPEGSTVNCPGCPNPADISGLTAVEALETPCQHCGSSLDWSPIIQRAINELGGWRLPRGGQPGRYLCNKPIETGGGSA